MDQFLASIPKTTLAILIILGAIFFVYVSDPPRTICDAQVEQFQGQIAGRLTKGVKDSRNKEREEPLEAKYQKFLVQCKIANSPGGCFQWFEEIKFVIRRLDAMGEDCRRKAASAKPVREFFWGTLEIMNQLAWGDTGPELDIDKANWLEAADIHLFCQVKKGARKLYGKEAYNKFRLKLYEILPNAKEMDRQIAWGKMLMSVRCNRY